MTSDAIRTSNLTNRLVGTTLFLLLISLLSSMAGMELFAWLLFLMMVAVAVRNKLGLWHPRRLVNWALGTFAVSVTIGVVLWGPPMSRAANVLGWLRWIPLFLAWTFLFRIFLRPSWEKGFRWWLILVGVVSVYAVAQFFLGIELTRSHATLRQFGNFFRASGFFDMPITFAYVLGMAGISALAYALVCSERRGAGQRRYAIFGSAIFSLCVLGILASMTRGAWVAMFGAVVAMVALWRPRAAVVAVLGFLILGVVAVASLPELGARFYSIFDPQWRDNSIRVMFWKAYLAVFLDHPVFGAGLGHVYELLKEYIPRVGETDIGFYSHAHNNVIHFLGSTGLAGTLSIATLWLTLLWMNIRLWFRLPQGEILARTLTLGAFGAQLIMHLGGITEANFIDGEVNHQLILWWGIIGALDAATTAKPLRTLERRQGR